MTGRKFQKLSADVAAFLILSAGAPMSPVRLSCAAYLFERRMVGERERAFLDDELVNLADRPALGRIDDLCQARVANARWSEVLAFEDGTWRLRVKGKDATAEAVTGFDTLSRRARTIAIGVADDLRGTRDDADLTARLRRDCREWDPKVTSFDYRALASALGLADPDLTMRNTLESRLMETTYG